MLDLSIVIVSWNVRDLLARCLDSIEAQVGDDLAYEVIVVDSASVDDTDVMLRERYAWVKLLAESTNVGFTRGNNLGLEQAQGRCILLLNPDTVIVANALSQMVSFLDENPDVGAVGPHTLNTPGSSQKTKRRFPTLITFVAESTPLGHIMPRRITDRYRTADIPDSATVDVDWVQGSAVMVRRALYEQIGPLDVGYFMYCEDLDWLRRAKDKGWRVVYLGSAQIIHYQGQSTKQAEAVNLIRFHQSKLRYLRKYYGPLDSMILHILLILSYLYWLFVAALKSIFLPQRAVHRQRARVLYKVTCALLTPGHQSV